MEQEIYTHIFSSRPLLTIETQIISNSLASSSLWTFNTYYSKMGVQCCRAEFIMIIYISTYLKLQQIPVFIFSWTAYWEKDIAKKEIKHIISEHFYIMVICAYYIFEIGPVRIYQTQWTTFNFIMKLKIIALKGLIYIYIYNEFNILYGLIYTMNLLIYQKYICMLATSVPLFRGY